MQCKEYDFTTTGVVLLNSFASVFVFLPPRASIASSIKHQHYRYEEHVIILLPGTRFEL